MDNKTSKERRSAGKGVLLVVEGRRRDLSDQPLDRSFGVALLTQNVSLVFYEWMACEGCGGVLAVILVLVLGPRSKIVGIVLDYPSN